MTNRSSTIKEGICRRSVLKSVPMIAGAIISTNAVAQNLFAQRDHCLHDYIGLGPRRGLQNFITLLLPERLEIAQEEFVDLVA